MKVITISVKDLAATITKVLREVEKGQAYEIVRYRKSVAWLGPIHLAKAEPKATEARETKPMAIAEPIVEEHSNTRPLKFGEVVVSECETCGKGQWVENKRMGRVRCTWPPCAANDKP